MSATSPPADMTAEDRDDLVIEGLAKGFDGADVLRGLDLTVQGGKLTAVLGASGSGKTTLLRLLMGFTRADAGRIRLGETLLAEAPRVHLGPERRGIGYVAQEGALFPHITVGENVGFGLPRGQRKGGPRIDAMLELVGLSPDYARRRPFDLSGGEQRRVALARALGPKPKVVLLDEPFSGLDPNARHETRQAVSQALSADSATALIVTHDRAEALSMSDTVAVLHNGLIAQVASPATLYERPISAAVAEFIGETSWCDGVADGGFVTCALGRLPLANDVERGPVAVMLRPQQLDATDAAVPGATAARVVNTSYVGGENKLRVQLIGSDVTLILRASNYGEQRTGEDIGVTVIGPVMAYRESRTRPKRLINT